jgi:hypothetical protein
MSMASGEAIINIAKKQAIFPMALFRISPSNITERK